MANFTLNSGNNKHLGTANADIIDGLDGNDTLLGLTGDDLLLGGNGLDSLDGGTGADTLRGGSGADVLLGNANDDRLLGEDGNDTLDGGNGADTLDGGSGGDRLTGGDGDDYYVIDNLADQIREAEAETGTDTVASLISFSLPDWIEHLILLGMETLTGTGNALNNRLTGNDAANGLDGGNGMDTLIGGAGADTLDGGFGVDELIGGDGDDLYRVSSIEDKLIETEGGGDQDEVQSTVDFSLIDYLENLTLTGFTALRGMGNRVANRLTGNAVANDLSGEAGDDTLQGGAGDDTLTGGQGNDVLDGGDGDDTVMYPGRISGYTVTARGDGTWQVIDTNPRDGDDGSDSLSGIERIAFADVLKTPADFTSQLPSFSIGSVSLNEGNSKTTTFKFPVTLTAPASSPVTVNYSLQGDTATPGQDYLNKKGSLRFNPGETRQTLDLPVFGDTGAEADESFTLRLANPLAARLDSRDYATITLTDDDTPSLALTGTTLQEGNSGRSNASLTVSLSAASPETVTVDYTTVNGTAEAGSDYTATSGSLSFAPGETRKSINVPVLGDTLYEADERFQVKLANASSNARIDTAASAATVQVGNDDLRNNEVKGQTVIDLGKDYGKLIQPVQVDGGTGFIIGMCRGMARLPTQKARAMPTAKTM